MFTFRSTLTVFLLLLVAVTVPAVSAADSALKPLTFHRIPTPLVLLDLTGKRHSLDDYRGKVVVVNFFGTWCPPCLQEMPSLLLLAEALKDQPFVVLAVDVGDSPARLRQVFGEEKGGVYHLARFQANCHTQLGRAGIPDQLCAGPRRANSLQRGRAGAVGRSQDR